MSVYQSAPIRRSMLSIAAAAVAWGTGGVVAAVLFRTSGLSVMAVSFWRLAVAVIILAVVSRPRTDPAVSWRAAVITGVGLALYQTAYFASVDLTGVALATLVTLGAGPMLIALGARHLLGERLSRSTAVAIGVGVAGLLLLVAGPVTANVNSLWGVILALVSASGYSSVTLYARAHGGSQSGLPVFTVGMLCLLPFAFVEGLLPHEHRLTGTIAGLLFLGVVPTLMAYRWYFAGLVNVPAAKASVIALLEPLTATVIAVVVLGDQISARSMLGAALLLGAVLITAKQDF